MPLKKHSFDDEKPRKKKYNKQERVLAKKTGGFRQPMSGAISGFKGDVKLKDFLLDLKSTEKMSISVKVEELQKIYQEALAYNQIAALVFNFEKVKDNHMPQQWVCFPMEDFLIIKDKLLEIGNGK